MASFQTVEGLAPKWAELLARPEAEGGLAGMPVEKREFLFNLLCFAAESERRGCLMPEKHVTGKRPHGALAVSDVRIWNDWTLAVGEHLAWKPHLAKWVRELEDAGWLARGEDLVWHVPRMIRGEI